MPFTKNVLQPETQRGQKRVANCLVTLATKVNIERHSAISIMHKIYLYQGFEVPSIREWYFSYSGNRVFLSKRMIR